ncbi:MAG: UDP-N-acetylmuramoyl-L-alanine--D-glutamate ligase [Sedimentisphaerales bacterium]|nr:UDP-N-acetylmuramoyl-L-alanine--D-glutamate ligase [Sedimentisphaerales bacterium]
MYTSRFFDDWKGKHVLVMGLGRFGGGVGVSRYLARQGAKVTVTDLCQAEDLAESIDQLQGLDLQFHLGGHRQADFEQNDIIVVNPAVPRDSPWLKVAGEHQVPLTSEMNIFFSQCPARMTGVTGSNGKSTTTAMTGEVLEERFKVWVGGNIGQGSLLNYLDEIGADDMVVLELSSFQLLDLAGLHMSPHVAVVTNIAPNHLDWHGTMEAYVRAKQNIIRYQGEGDYLIINCLEENLSSWAELGKGSVVWYPKDGWEDIELKVPGRHNRLNAAAAMAVGELFGIEPARARERLKRFTGLPHRLELVREFEGVCYYNDSIATTPESVLVALDAFTEPKVLILGGYDKKISLDKLAQGVVGRVDTVIVLGQVRDSLTALLEKYKELSGEGDPAIIKADNFESGVEKARKAARAGMLVLLSPACASYDMFRNFQQRGEIFKKIVNNF